MRLLRLFEGRVRAEVIRRREELRRCSRCGGALLVRAPARRGELLCRCPVRRCVAIGA